MENRNEEWKLREKVVGTSFVEQKSVKELDGTLLPKEQGEYGVAEFHTQALLVPEPTNEYDPTAVAVVIRTKEGAAHRVGYLARTSPIKEGLNGVTPMKLTIYGYSEIGLSDSFVLGE